jgi:hypothetical protein
MTLAVSNARIDEAGLPVDAGVYPPDGSLTLSRTISGP